MEKHSYILLKPLSITDTITMEDVKKWLNEYITSVKKTGKQVGWEYDENAFPYEIQFPSQEVLSLLSNSRGYQSIQITVTERMSKASATENETFPCIKITLSNSSTYGDKSKANEFAKYLAKKLKGELELFNGRVMHFDLKK